MTASLRQSAAVRIFYNPTVMVSLALMAVIVMMILPVPSWVVDIGLTASFALAILIFITSLSSSARSTFLPFRRRCLPR